MACTRLDKAPWDFSPETLKRFAPGVYDPDKQDVWELYYLPDDFSQARNLVAYHPSKLAELQALWWKEAERNRVLPLLGGMAIFFGNLPPMSTTSRFAFAGDVQNIQRGMVPRVYGRSYAIEAELLVPDTGAEGVIVANADFIGGFGLWVVGDGLLHHTYSFLGVETYRQTSREPIPHGDVKLTMLFEADEAKPGTVPIGFTSYGGMDIGRDNGLVVDRHYEAQAPYAFTGTVKRVVFDLKPHTHAEEQALHEQGAMAQLGRGLRITPSIGQAGEARRSAETPLKLRRFCPINGGGRCRSTPAPGGRPGRS